MIEGYVGASLIYLREKKSLHRAVETAMINDQIAGHSMISLIINVIGFVLDKYNSFNLRTINRYNMLPGAIICSVSKKSLTGWAPDAPQPPGLSVSALCRAFLPALKTARCREIPAAGLRKKEKDAFFQAAARWLLLRLPADIG